jgi:hypothetical protein
MYGHPEPLLAGLAALLKEAKEVVKADYAPVEP